MEPHVQLSVFFHVLQPPKYKPASTAATPDHFIKWCNKLTGARAECGDVTLAPCALWQHWGGSCGLLLQDATCAKMLLGLEPAFVLDSARVSPRSDDLSRVIAQRADKSLSYTS